MQKLTPAERSELRAEAHGLKPVVMIGESGLTESVMKEISASLDSHGLIKVRVAGDDREARVAMYEQICEELQAQPVQHIGKLLVVYRPKVDTVKASASGTKRPSVTKVMIKGNERVTEGGTIKRAKPRQTSPKKGALGR